MGTIDSWSSIETIIKQRLDLNEIGRRYCAVCRRQGPSLSRCFGCQMVYYCGEEHQAEDWTKEHSQKCTQLQWVALGEFIQALPAQPPLPKLGDKWLLTFNEINNWKSWFSIRKNIVNLAHNTANIFKNLIHLTDKRQPSHQNAVDGLLAAVTDLLTHVLTIGKALIYFSLQPNNRPLLIHILNGFNKIDLINNDQSSTNLPARFHELLNMFPDNKGVELVIVIGDDDQDDSDHSSLPHAKLKPDRLIITTTGKGHLLDTFEEKRLERPEADLFVYFNAAHLFMSSNKELLRIMLTRQRPTLLTFDDEEEFNQAKKHLITKGIDIYQAGTNQFGSLIIRQRLNRPNSTYSTNSYQILLNKMTINGTVERNDENYSLLSRQRSHQSSIDIQQQQQQQFNPGLKQVNGKMHTESLSSSSSSSSHNTQANNNGTLLDTNVHIVSTSNTALTTTVQPLGRSNNNICQPTIVKRQNYSSPIAEPSSSSFVISSTTHREVRPTSNEMTTAIEPNRIDNRPQPKPRLSLVKTTNHDTESVKLQTNGSIVQRIKPFFEQASIHSPSQESKPIKQQRQPISIPYTYQTGKLTKATCLDDIISPTNVHAKSSLPEPPKPVEIHSNGRTDNNTTIISCSSSSSSVPIDIRREQRSVINTTVNVAAQITKPTNEYCSDERIIKPIVNSVSSPLPIPIEIHHEQRSIVNTTRIVSSPPTSTYIENRSDERLNNTFAKPYTPSPPPLPPPKPIETDVDNSFVPSTTTTSNPSPPPRPTPPPLANNEVIYTEVIKNRERSLSSHQTDFIKTTISPSRSFVIPTKSPSISSKNASFNYQRPSRPLTTNNFSYDTHKSKSFKTTLAPDRISLYSQRSNKQSDIGVTIENISECIDRVGIVFDETNRPNNLPSSGLTTVDLIREQLTTSSTPRSTGSLLDKLYKSNSSTRLSTSATRTPRSKSQQTTVKTPSQEQPSISKITPATSQPTNRRTVGVSLPITPKPPTHEPEQIKPISPLEQSSSNFYQNLEPHISTNTISVASSTSAPQQQPLPLPSSHMPDYTLKQPSGPLCTGIPKPFRKPTAIIEPSPVIISPISIPSEPNYINLTHQDEHIYTNENGFNLPNSSNSNSYTSKTSSIYSSSDKQNNPSTHPEIVYAVTNISTTSSHQEQTVDYDSFDDELVVDDNAKIEKSYHSNDNTDEDSFDDDNNNENQSPQPTVPSKNPTTTTTNFLRSTLNRLTRSNKSLDRLNLNDTNQDSNQTNIIDTKTKKTLRSIKARREAKKTGNLFLTYTNDDDTTSIDSTCSTQTANSLNKTAKSSASSHNRFRLFRRKIEKEFASDTEAEKHQTEQRRKKFNKKVLNYTADELKTKRLLMMSDDDDDGLAAPLDSHRRHHHQNSIEQDEPHIYDHIIHDDINTTTTTNNNNITRMGKLSNETHVKSPTITLDEIRSEIQAEIAARQDHMTINNQSTTTTSSNINLQKKRSKSVTFLDELLGDDTKQKQTNLITKNELQIKPSTTVKRIEKGDARSICGALTGTGPIRGIIKAANNDITGTTAPVSPSAAAAIYLSGTSVETRCTSPKANERTHRPLSTYTVGSARFYDGASASSTVTPSTSSSSSSNQNNNNSSNHRPILTHHSTSDNTHHKRPTAKVSPFQTKSVNESSSSPISTTKQTALSSTSKKPIRPSTHRNMSTSHDITNIATPSVSDGVGGVSKRLQSNF